MDLIRIGTFDVYPGERMRPACGKPVDIGARAFDLLLVLAESPGRARHQGGADRARLAAARGRREQPACADREPAATPGTRGDSQPFRAMVTGSTCTCPAAMHNHLPRTAPWRNARGRLRARPAMPVRREPLIGRRAELRAICDTLAHERHLTLVGAAGVGKSRLAQEVLALEPPDGAAAWVALEPLDDIERVPSAIALALGVSLTGEGDRFAALGRALAGSAALLVLDGAEHLAVALAEPLAVLAAGERGLRVLVTSQTPLGRPGEAVYRLDPLPSSEAVALFAQRAAQADQRFSLAAGQYGARRGNLPQA